jgi:hypothetical protein
MAIRTTNVPSVTLIQVAHEGNPTNTNVLTVVGTLDGTPALTVAMPGVSDVVRDGSVAAEGN